MMNPVDTFADAGRGFRSMGLFGVIWKRGAQVLLVVDARQMSLFPGTCCL